MITRLLSVSVQAHWPVVFLTVMVAAYGSYELTRLPLDALPDITNKQVMINFAAPAFGPEDVEKRNRVGEVLRSLAYFSRRRVLRLVAPIERIERWHFPAARRAPVRNRAIMSRTFHFSPNGPGQPSGILSYSGRLVGRWRGRTPHESVLSWVGTGQGPN
jgi:hypothetical protein